MFLSFFELFLQLSFSDPIDPDLFSKIGGLRLGLSVGTDLGFISTDLSLQAFDFFTVSQYSLLV